MHSSWTAPKIPNINTECVFAVAWRCTGTDRSCGLCSGCQARGARGWCARRMLAPFNQWTVCGSASKTRLCLERSLFGQLELHLKDNQFFLHALQETDSTNRIIDLQMNSNGARPDEEPAGVIRSGARRVDHALLHVAACTPRSGLPAHFFFLVASILSRL